MVVESPSGPIKQIMIGKETTWGTAVSADKDAGLIITESGISWEREVMESFGLAAIDAQKITTGIFDPKFTIAGEYQHGRLLEYVFGTVGHVETTSDWTHTFTIADAPPSMSVSSAFNQTTDLNATSAGMFIESCEISSEVNGKLLVNLGFVGKTVETDTTAPSYTQSTLVVFPHALISCTINSVKADICQSASITISKSALRAGGLGSNLYQQGAVDEMSFEWTATLGFTDAEYHALFLGGTTPSATSDPTSFEFELDATNGVALGSGLRQLKIVLENCQASGFNDATSVGNITFVELTGKGTLKSAVSVDNISSATW